MCDWTGCIGAKIKPKAQLHLPIPSTSKSEPHPSTSEQFEFANNDTLEEYSKGLIPVNTGRLKLYMSSLKKMSKSFGAAEC